MPAHFFSVEPLANLFFNLLFDVFGHAEARWMQHHVGLRASLGKARAFWRALPVTCTRCTRSCAYLNGVHFRALRQNTHHEPSL